MMMCLGAIKKELENNEGIEDNCSLHYCNLWQTGVRSLFGLVNKKYNHSNSFDTWELIRLAIVKEENISGNTLEWLREILMEEKNITVEDARAMAIEFSDRTPLLNAITTLLQD